MRQVLCLPGDVAGAGPKWVLQAVSKGGEGSLHISLLPYGPTRAHDIRCGCVRSSLGGGAPPLAPNPARLDKASRWWRRELRHVMDSLCAAAQDMNSTYSEQSAGPCVSSASAAASVPSNKLMPPNMSYGNPYWSMGQSLQVCRRGFGFKLFA